MAGTKQALAPSSTFPVPPLKRSILSLAAACLAGLGPAQAAGVDCSAINRGALNIEVDAAAPALRQAALKGGEMLTFTYRSAEGPLGTVQLLPTAGSSRLLLVGPAGTSVGFVAATRGTFSFEFSHEGEGAADFFVTCAPAGSTGHRNAGAPLKTGPLVGNWSNLEPVLEELTAPIALDTGAPAARGAMTPGIVIEQAAIARPPAAAGSAEMKLQWRDQRLKAGPEGPEIDGNASGVDIGLKLKLQPGIVVGALAQFEQPGDTLVGVPRSLLDQGWLMGPVTNMKLAPGLSLDAHAAWGITEGAGDDLAGKNTSAPRRVVSARLANVQSFGGWRLTPSLSISHFQDGLAPAPATHETAFAYPSAYGRVDVGPELAYRIELDRSVFIEPKAAIGQFWAFDNLSKLAPGSGPHAESRFKAQAGVTIGAGNGPKLQAGGGVEEGDASTPNVWSGRLQLNVPMQ